MRWEECGGFWHRGEWPPEQVRALTGEVSGDGPVGFSAALLPYLRAFKDEPAYQRQWQRVQQQIPQADGTPRTSRPTTIWCWHCSHWAGWISGIIFRPMALWSWPEISQRQHRVYCVRSIPLSLSV